MMCVSFSPAPGMGVLLAPSSRWRLGGEMTSPRSCSWGQGRAGICTQAHWLWSPHSSITAQGCQDAELRTQKSWHIVSTRHGGLWNHGRESLPMPRGLPSLPLPYPALLPSKSQSLQLCAFPSVPACLSDLTRICLLLQSCLWLCVPVLVCHSALLSVNSCRFPSKPAAWPPVPRGSTSRVFPAPLTTNVSFVFTAIRDLSPLSLHL